MTVKGEVGHKYISAHLEHPVTVLALYSPVLRHYATEAKTRPASQHTALTVIHHS
jgi:hypothetical protein